MSVKCPRIRVVCALAFAMSGCPALAQDADGRSEDGLNLTVKLEDPAELQAAANTLVLPALGRPRPATASEQNSRFQSAGFVRPNRLEAVQIRPDDLPRGVTAVAVRCQAFIGADGGLGDYFCVSDDNRAYAAAVTAVIRAVPTQRFVPARADGINVRVLMNFAVYIDCSSGSCFEVAARNHGYDAEQFGLDYVDPQPILANDEWYQGFDYKLHWAMESTPEVANRSRWNPFDRLEYVMAADIRPDGTASPACLYWVGARGALIPPRTKTAIQRAITSLGNVRYVPGMIEGMPATIRLHEQSVTKYEAQSLVMFAVSDIDCE